MADDQRLMVDVVERLLDGSVVVSCVSSGEALIDDVVQQNPDLVISETELTGVDGLSALSTLRLVGIATPFLFLTGNASPRLMSKALRRGAQGYLLKTGSGDDLRTAVTMILNGGTYTSAEIPTPWTKDRERSRFHPKQAQVAEYFLKGLTTQQIAITLQLSVKSVETYLHWLRREYEAQSNAQLIRKIKEAMLDQRLLY
ncbi:response regulator [Dyella sp. 2YAF14]|uniref:response regulator n=1 Tax=Dyella sp. 2YAF14 TaxID=3233025 RepID=UPI003F90135B